VRKGLGAWLLLIMATVFAVLGNLVGDALSGPAPLLGRSVSIGIDPPFVADLGFAALTFGFSLSLNLVGLLGLILGIFLYRRWS